MNRILALAAAFAVFSTLAYVIGGARTGTPLLVISALILGAFLLEQAKVGWYYDVSDEALFIRRTFKLYHIPGAAIARIVKVGWHGVMERVHRCRYGETQHSGVSRQVALGRLIGFSSVPVPIRASSPPSGAEVFVVVGLHDGREYILSPAYPESFVKELQRLSNRMRTKT